MSVGRRGDDGRFPDGSLYAKAEARLRQYAEAQRRFARPERSENGETRS
jgi:hypothetical protein